MPRPHPTTTARPHRGRRLPLALLALCLLVALLRPPASALAATTATADSYAATEDTPLTVAAPGVLGNDSATTALPLTAVLIAAPAHGTVVLNADGSFTYTPYPDFNGPDSFAYQANDGISQSAVVPVTLTVDAVNDAPVANADRYSMPTDTVLTVITPGIRGNDTDAEGSSLTVILVSGPANGFLTLNPDGSFTYTPNAGYTGSDSFTYRASDGTTFSTAVPVTINVGVTNAAPTANGDSYTTDEDTPLPVIQSSGVFANDFDSNNDPLTAILVTGAANGTVVLNPDGSFLYTPYANYTGTDRFTYQALDQYGQSAVVSVTITVTAQNDAPVARNDRYEAIANTPLTIAAPGVIGNDTDVDSGPLTAVIVTGPTHGTLALNPDGSFSYTPNAGYTGPDSFTYLASDGSALSPQATVTITIPNTAPVATPDNYLTPPIGPLVVPAPGILGNDLDLDGTPLTATLVTGPTNGTLTLNTDGSFTYTPNMGYSGPDTFTYQASDGTALSPPTTVTITVIFLPIPPTANPDLYNATVDTPLVVPAPGVLANDIVVNGGTLTATLFPVSGPTNGTLTFNSDGSFTYTPNPGYIGLDSFQYQAFNGGFPSIPTTVTLLVGPPTNLPPIASADTYTAAEDIPLIVAAPGVLANDFDPDSNPLRALLVSGPAHGSLTLNLDGSFTYSPVPNYNGPDSFTYRANDGTADSPPVTVSLFVTPQNDAPAAQADTYGTPENTPLTVAAPGVLGNDTDIEGDSLTAVLASGPAHGTLALNADGSFTYTPATNYAGFDQFSYHASDGQALSAPVIVTLQVSDTVTLTTGVMGQGTVAVSPAAGAYPFGTVVTLTPQAASGSLFVGWVVDSAPAGWAPTLMLTLDRDRAVVAQFATVSAFADLGAGDPAYTPVRELAARGIVRGYDDGRFGPADPLLRAQAAALVARALGWDFESWGNLFSDQGSVDDNLWRNIGTLNHYGVARGFGDGTYQPAAAVNRAQFISLITRAMVARGYWAMQPDDPARFPGVGDTGHRQDLITYQFYVGAFPNLTEGSGAAAWFAPADRGWTARALWAALDQYNKVDRVP